MSKKRFALFMELAPGDVTVLTPLVRDFHRTYGDKYELETRTNHPGIFAHNPYVAKNRDPGAIVVDMHGHKPGMERAGRGEKIHFSRFLYDIFESQTGLKVPMLESKSDLYLSEYEKAVPPISGRYWLFFAGGKSDVYIKHWPSSYYQEVVNRLLQLGIHSVQTGGSTKGKTKHIHPPLNNVLNIVGWGGIREMIWQIYHAEGIVCPITAAMHMASAFNKPCVVVAGGREEPWWEAYTNEYGAFGPHAAPISVEHRYLNTLGQLDCCATKGCWKKKVVKIDDDDKLCYLPVIKPKEAPVAKCMDMITPDQVISAVMSYYADGTLPSPDKSSIAPTLTVAYVPKVKPRVIDPLSPVSLLNGAQPAPSLIQHPAVGGRFTVCTLLYGNYPALHKRCLLSIVESIPSDYMELRVALNQVTKETEDFVDSLPVYKLYKHESNLRKYPAMREMLYDVEAPITTKYVVWLDDDAYCVLPNWYEILSKAIIENHASDVAMYGELLNYQVPEEGKQWFTGAAWHKGRKMRDRYGSERSGGNYIQHCRGSFWCINTDIMRRCDIPDQRLLQKGGNQAIAEQLWQNGYYIKNINTGGSLVAIPSGKTRGFNEQLPWLKHKSQRVANAT